MNATPTTNRKSEHVFRVEYSIRSIAESYELAHLRLTPDDYEHSAADVAICYHSPDQDVPKRWLWGGQIWRPWSVFYPSRDTEVWPTDPEPL